MRPCKKCGYRPGQEQITFCPKCGYRYKEVYSKDEAERLESERCHY